MIKNLIVCDRCDAKVDVSMAKHIPSWRTISGSVFGAAKDRDVCPACAESFDAWWIHPEKKIAAAPKRSVSPRLDPLDFDA